MRNLKNILSKNLSLIDKAIEAIKGSERPVIYAGGGVITSGGSSELVKFAEKAMIPVTTSLMGLVQYLQNIL